MKRKKWSGNVTWRGTFPVAQFMGFHNHFTTCSPSFTLHLFFLCRISFSFPVTSLIVSLFSTQENSIFLRFRFKLRVFFKAHRGEYLNFRWYFPRSWYTGLPELLLRSKYYGLEHILRSFKIAEHSMICELKGEMITAFIPYHFISRLLPNHLCFPFLLSFPITSDIFLYNMVFFPT